MYNAASGMQQVASKRGVASQNETVEISPRTFKIFFPSQQTVQRSLGGPGYPFPPCLNLPTPYSHLLMLTLRAYTVPEGRFV